MSVSVCVCVCVGGGGGGGGRSHDGNFKLLKSLVPDQNWCEVVFVIFCHHRTLRVKTEQSNMCTHHIAHSLIPRPCGRAAWERDQILVRGCPNMKRWLYLKLSSSVLNDVSSKSLSKFSLMNTTVNIWRLLVKYCYIKLPG